MHKLKEELIELFDSVESWDKGLIKISEWMEKAHHYFSQSCQTIRRWLGEIVAYFDRRTTQGLVEGLNNKLKLIKRKAYGFRNFKNLGLPNLWCRESNYDLDMTMDLAISYQFLTV